MNIIQNTVLPHLLKDVIVGLISGYVPIYATASHFEESCVKDGVSYTDIARYNIFMFIPVTIIVMNILRLTGQSNNYLLAGFIFAMTYSSIGRFIGDYTSKVFEMDNPNMFHVYAIVSWELFYNIVARAVYDYV